MWKWVKIMYKDLVKLILILDVIILIGFIIKGQYELASLTFKFLMQQLMIIVIYDKEE